MSTHIFASLKTVRIVAVLTAMILGLLLFRVHGATVGTNVDVEFDRHWSIYLMAEFGCPVTKDGHVAEPLTPGDCHLPPQLLADEKAKARELAKKVFNLGEPGK